VTKADDPTSVVHASSVHEASWEEDPLNHMIKVFIAFLQTIFEEAPPGRFHWRPEPEESEIIITEENPVHVDAIERKPVISIILGPTKFNGSSLDDLVSLDARNAKEVHTDLLPGNISMNCMSKVPQECRYLGWQCARHLWILRKLFIRETHIHEIGRTHQIGSVTPAGALVQGDTEGEWHSAPVQCPFFMQWTDSVTSLKEDWNGRPIAPLRNVELKLATRLGVAQPNLTHTQETGQRLWGEQATSIRSPRIRGRQIRQDSQSQQGSQSNPLDLKFKV
jgi:hypothetical protein